MNWKALYVASRSEKKVVSRLTELGLDTYLPLRKEKRQWSDRKKTVITPLINGYVFVKTDEAQRDLVFRAEGVVQYVRFNGTDAVIKEKEIEALRIIEEKGYFIEGEFADKINVGDLALIKHGPFKGLNGIIEKTVGADMFMIGIESIGYILKIKIPAEILQVK